MDPVNFSGKNKTVPRTDRQEIFSHIHEEYLRAIPPQQMTKLKKMFQNIIPLTTIPSSPQVRDDREANDLVFKTKDNELSCSLFSEKMEQDSENLSTVNILNMLYDVTIGYRGEVDTNENFTQPAIQYRISFAKYIIKQLESGNYRNTDASIEDEKEAWYNELEQLSSLPVLTEPFYRLYKIQVPCNDDNTRERTEIVKIFENETSFVSDGTTGLVTWEASIEFLRWFTGDRTEWEKPYIKMDDTRWIIELGCGCGFLAVALTKCLPFIIKYIATDVSSRVLEKVKHNVDANFSNATLLRKKVSFEKVDWQEESKESFTQMVDGMTNIYGRDSGILLGADIVFDPDILPDLVALIKYFVEGRAGKVLISWTRRNEATMGILMQLLGSAGLSTVVAGKWQRGEIILIS